MNGTLDDRYFEWLYGQVGTVRNRNPARSYWKLLRQLYAKEFVWHVANDDNRVEDGKDLRDEFLSEQGFDGADSAWMSLGCSVLEMLIALARRTAFESTGAPGDWFWRFMVNLNLRQFTDAHFTEITAALVDERLDVFIFRQYSMDGSGGIFPLQYSQHDQRKVELWYQMSEYLLQDSSI